MQAYVVRPVLIALLALILAGFWQSGGTLALGYGSACRAGAPATALPHWLHCRAAGG
jgi:hypothetical protein